MCMVGAHLKDYNDMETCLHLWLKTGRLHHDPVSRIGQNQLSSDREETENADPGVSAARAVQFRVPAGADTLETLFVSRC